MSDALQTIQIMLTDAASWRGRMEERMDETITTLHTVASSVERHAMQSTTSNALMEARLDATGKNQEAISKRLSALEAYRPGGKKNVAVAAGVGGTGGVMATLLSSSVLDFAATLLKKIGL